MFLDAIAGWFTNDISIDLGTANTLDLRQGEGHRPQRALRRRGRASRPGKVIAVGNEAKAMLGRTPGEIEAVRPLKDGVIADFEMTENMLREFITQASRSAEFFVRPRIMICVPSGITEVEKRAVRDSAENAGAREVFLVAEPIAAAIGVGLPVEKPAGNMVIDIGGGTTEIAVIALSGIVTATSIRVGGDEMDEAIVQHREEALQPAHRRADGGARSRSRIGSAVPARGGRGRDGNQGTRSRRGDSQDAADPLATRSARR